MVRIKAPAKINLTLDVIGKIGNYHEVDMIMTTIDFSDYVTVRLNENSDEKEKIKIVTEHGVVPGGEKNLCHRAATLFFAHFNIKAAIIIELDKHIFISAGLGGGSSNAAATLVALRDLFNVDCSDEILCQIAAKLGSDIPFFIKGGTVRATGRGEILTPLPTPPACWIVLVNPKIAVSTADVYKGFTPSMIKGKQTPAMIAALESQSFDEVCLQLGNQLERVTLVGLPILQEIKEHLASAGAQGVLMSGSGATIFGLVYTEKKAHAIYQYMKKAYPRYDVQLARMLG